MVASNWIGSFVLPAHLPLDCGFKSILLLLLVHNLGEKQSIKQSSTIHHIRTIFRTISRVPLSNIYWGISSLDFCLLW